jgi:hypothetical protein
MNPALLLELISDPKKLDRESLVQLRSLVSAYPCFAPARILYLKNLYQQDDLRFASELNRTAISVPDRKRLYCFMEDKLTKTLLTNSEEDSVENRDFSIIDHFLHNSGKLNNTDNSGLSHEKVTDLQKKQVKINNVVSTDTHHVFGDDSFSLDYLSYMAIYPKTEIATSAPFPDSEPEQVVTVPMKGQNLIDAFLTDSSLEKSLEITLENDESEAANEELPFAEEIPEATFTETLAKIYIKQKRYDRSLEIIKSLSLKYPEKNVYFADQIRFLEKLIINTKKQ